MPKNGSKMAKNALNDPIFGVQALKTSYFLITNVIGPIQGKKVEKNRSLCHSIYRPSSKSSKT